MGIAGNGLPEDSTVLFIEADWVSTEGLQDNLLETERLFIDKWRSLRPGDQKMLENMTERLLRNPAN